MVLLVGLSPSKLFLELILKFNFKTSAAHFERSDQTTPDSIRTPANSVKFHAAYMIGTCGGVGWGGHSTTYLTTYLTTPAASPPSRAKGMIKPHSQMMTRAAMVSTNLPPSRTMVLPINFLAVAKSGMS